MKKCKVLKNPSDPLAPQKHCSVFLKKNNKIRIKCSSCKQNVHKKCPRLKHSEILDLANFNPNFECMSCLTEKLTFVFQNNLDIQKHCLNSNFLCKFQKTLSLAILIKIMKIILLILMFILILMSWNSLKRGPKPITKLIIYVIHGYQTFHDIGWQSLNNGCGFFVKDGLKYKQRTDFEMSFKDGNNEFSFAG